MSQKKLMSLDDMFGDIGIKSTVNAGVTEIEIINLIPFDNHPFKLYEGERLNDLVSSVKEFGVIVPIIVRPFENEKYQILSGHNRVNAAKLTGLTKISVVIKEGLTEDEAVLIVTETNLLQRSFSEMLYSERAIVLSEHHKALVSQGKRTDLLKEIETMLKADDTRAESTSRQRGKRLTSADETGRNYDLSGRTVSRYLRICNLIKELMDRLDREEIQFLVSIELSYLAEEEQHTVEDIISERKFKIDLKKAETLRDYSGKQNFNEETAYSILSGELNKKPKSIKPKSFKLKPKLISKYFSSGVKQPEIEDVIDKALTLYFDTQGKEVLDE